MPLDLTTPLGVTLALLPEIRADGLVPGRAAAWSHGATAPSDDSRLAGWLSLVGVVRGRRAALWLWLCRGTRRRCRRT